MRLRIRGKLLGAAAAVSLVGLGMGLVAVSSLQTAARQSRILYEKIAVPLVHLYVLGEAYEEVRDNKGTPGPRCAQ